MNSVRALDFAFSLNRSKRSPSYRKLICTLNLYLMSLKASNNKTAGYIPKSVRASLQPCFTPRLYWNDWVSSPSIMSLALTSVYSFLMILINFGGHPSLPRIMRSRSRLTLSKALTKSTNAMYRFFLCSLDFCIKCRSVKIPSMVPYLYDNQTGIAGRCTLLNNAASVEQCRSEKTLPTTLRKDIPL